MRPSIPLRAGRLLAALLLAALLLPAAPSGAAPAPQPAARGRVAPDLVSLAAERRADVAAGATSPFRSANPTLLLDSAGERVAVQVTALDVAALLPALRARGFELLGSAPELHLAEGFVPIGSLAGLADLSGQGLLGVVSVGAPQRGAGSVTSQADVAHEAERVRASAGGFDGSGLCVGILSDSYNRLGGAPAGVASGDLPAGVVVLQEGPAAGVADEGRAMAELVHDLAPGAGIAFASAFLGQAAFAASIRDLASPSGAGCPVITDDIFYFDEPLFQDGLIAQAIDEVVGQRGVAYFALAGNLARQSYETDGFRAAGDAALGAGSYHDFDPGAGLDTRQRITIPQGANVILTLQWDDPFYTTDGVDSDVDIFLLPAGSNTPVASATADNLATQVPSERFSFTNSSGGTQFDVAIELFAGPAPTRLKYVNYGANSSADITFNEFGTDSATIIPHGAASRGRGVGAVNYDAQDAATTFSSAGPFTAIFAADGTRLAAPVVRQKPDFVAVQGTDTTFFGSDADGNGFPNFFGTSAAAPHAAAIAALVRQAHPSLTPEQVYARLDASARDLGPAGRDDLTGLGLINAYDAVFGAPAATSALPFSEGVEAGALGLSWETQSTGAGRIRASTSGGPAAGARHVLLDTARGGFSGLNELVLHINLSGASDVELAFQQREYADADDPMPASFSGSSDSDGVAISVDGVSWRRLVSLTGAASGDSYRSYSFDLSQFAADSGLALGGDVRIKFQQFGSQPFDGPTAGGMAFDGIVVSGLRNNTPPVAQGALPSQRATPGVPFLYTVPANAFTDADIGDTLSYSAALAGGGALPAWLSFSPATRSFSGTPAPADEGTLLLVVRASDTAGAGAEQPVTVFVEPGTRVFLPLVGG